MKIFNIYFMPCLITKYNSYNEDVTLKVFITIFIAAPVPFAVVCSVWRQCSMSTLWGQNL